MEPLENAGKDPILVFEDVCAGYGKDRVLDKLSFTVDRGQVLGVIGPNGCGKTTMLNTIMGTVHLSSGIIRLYGRNISKLPTDARCRMGIGRTFQIPRPFIRMNVYENVLVSSVFGGSLSESAAREPTLIALRLTGMLEKAKQPAGTLTLLDRKRLEIARAIVFQPGLLLLDEVAAGLSGEEIEEVIQIVSALRAQGFAIIWIEHIIEAMLRGTDRLMCIAQGRSVMIGSPQEVLCSKAVEELYLGRKAAEEHDAEN